MRQQFARSAFIWMLSIVAILKLGLLNLAGNLLNKLQTFNPCDPRTFQANYVFRATVTLQEEVNFPFFSGAGSSPFNEKEYPSCSG